MDTLTIMLTGLIAIVPLSHQSQPAFEAYILFVADANHLAELRLDCDTNAMNCDRYHPLTGNLTLNGVSTTAWNLTLHPDLPAQSIQLEDIGSGGTFNLSSLPSTPNPDQTVVAVLRVRSGSLDPFDPCLIYQVKSGRPNKTLADSIRLQIPVEDKNNLSITINSKEIGIDTDSNGNATIWLINAPPETYWHQVQSKKSELDHVLMMNQFSTDPSGNIKPRTHDGCIFSECDHCGPGSSPVKCPATLFQTYDCTGGC